MSSPNQPTTILKTVVFMGSAKTVVPPWGGDARAGDRALKWVKATLAERSETLGSSGVVKHDITILDPVELFAAGGALAEISAGELTTPTFFVKDLPPAAQQVKQSIVDADCYVIVSPEYNHSVPPALSSLMGHFGGSCYKCTPCGIVTYSPGPWGGMRAAMAIQVMCHELGTLPVSKLCGLPMISDLLNENGTPKDPQHRMLKQLPAMLDQSIKIVFQ